MLDKRLLIATLGHDFTDESLVDLALSHRSVGAKNNERLEFLGDSILGFVIGEALYQKFPKIKEGELSQMRSKLVKGKTLAELAREFELGNYLKLGQGELKSGGFRRESILADTVEALIGAMYLDAGMDTCKHHLLRWYASRLEAICPQGGHKDPKTLLQELLQSRKKNLPTYEVLNTSGDDHQQHFEVKCRVADIKQGFVGEGSNRRAAEQAAATKALAVLQSSS